MKRTLLAVVAVVCLAAGCGQSDTPVAASSVQAKSTTVANAGTAENVEVTTTSAKVPDALEEGLDKEARQKVQDDPDGSAKLAAETSRIVGETATPFEAHWLAGFMCMGIKLNNLADEWEVADQENIAAELGKEMGLSKGDTARLMSLAVKFHCPEVAN